MKKLTGYVLLVVGLLGFGFFLNYGGSAFPDREMWFVLSGVVGAIGASILTKLKLKKTFANYMTERRQLVDLRNEGGKIRVTLDNCEVRSRSYREDITNYGMPSRIEMMDGDRNYKTREVLQTYIVYYKIINGVEHKFISEARPVTKEVMQLFLERKGGVNLYIDKKDPTKYVFDLPNIGLSSIV